ncbi:MAG TPA: hypothetical protein VKU77_01310 [Streptosporangiaceae bacterium]|nr:hypothetical protein [Streptosporangiaceae bacterium]
MGAMGEYAAKLEAAAAWLRDQAALDVCDAQARDFLAIERIVTPKRSGHLADSETIDSISGGGGHARAIVSPHAVYAQIQNDGGTIHAHAGLGLKGKRPHTLHWDGGGFPLEVTLKGHGYVEKAEGLAAGALRQAAEAVIEAGLNL